MKTVKELIEDLQDGHEPLPLEAIYVLAKAVSDLQDMLSPSKEAAPTEADLADFEEIEGDPEDEDDDDEPTTVPQPPQPVPAPKPETPESDSASPA